METSLGKPCRDTFTEKFSLAPHSGDEVTGSATAITEMLAVRWLNRADAWPSDHVRDRHLKTALLHSAP
jgi:hypothetical protein